jgi:hypothetical protein
MNERVRTARRSAPAAAWPRHERSPHSVSAPSRSPHGRSAVAGRRAGRFRGDTDHPWSHVGPKRARPTCRTIPRNTGHPWSHVGPKRARSTCRTIPRRRGPSLVPRGTEASSADLPDDSAETRTISGPTWDRSELVGPKRARPTRFDGAVAGIHCGQDPEPRRGRVHDAAAARCGSTSATSWSGQEDLGRPRGRLDDQPVEVDQAASTGCSQPCTSSECFFEIFFPWDCVASGDDDHEEAWRGWASSSSGCW